jgi:hypothetical protein
MSRSISIRDELERGETKEWLMVTHRWMDGDELKRFHREYVSVC